MSFPGPRLATVSRAALAFSGSMPSNALSWLVRASMSLHRPADSALIAEILFTRSGTLYAISAPSSATHTGKPSFTTTWPFSSSLSFMVSFSVRVRASRRGIPWHHVTIGGQGRIIGHEYRPAAGMCRKGLFECFCGGKELTGRMETVYILFIVIRRTLYDCQLQGQRNTASFRNRRIS